MNHAIVKGKVKGIAAGGQGVQPGSIQRYFYAAGLGFPSCHTAFVKVVLCALLGKVEGVGGAAAVLQAYTSQVGVVAVKNKHGIFTRANGAGGWVAVWSGGISIASTVLLLFALFTPTKYIFAAPGARPAGLAMVLLPYAIVPLAPVVIIVVALGALAALPCTR